MGSPPPHRRPLSELPPLPRDPLFRAAYLGDRSALLTLLYEGANPNARDTEYRGTRLLQYAVIGGHVGTVEMLIRNGAQIEAVGLFNVTPLLIARPPSSAPWSAWERRSTRLGPKGAGR